MINPARKNTFSLLGSNTTREQGSPNANVARKNPVELAAFDDREATRILSSEMTGKDRDLKASSWQLAAERRSAFHRGKTPWRKDVIACSGQCPDESGNSPRPWDNT